MKTRFLSMALIASVLTAAAIAGFEQTVVAQITFLQAPQNRNQTQDQRGLPPEKKKSLSRYGPEDAFPGAGGQDESRGRNSRTRQKSQRASSSKAAPTPKQSSNPKALVAEPSPPPTQAMAARPGPTTLTALGNQVQQLPSARQSSSSEPAPQWTVPVLAGLALVVSIALIYVLAKLIGKIREDNA